VELSCKTEYALLALLELASRHNTGTPLQIRQIATEQDIPDRYLEQLLATLRRSGVVKSQRGAKGGYLLARDPWKITLWDIVSCIEGLDSPQQPVDEVPKSTESMVVFEIWQEARQAAEAVLQRYTLQDLTEQRDARQQRNIMYYI
jgi:Rrf2 family protein